MKGNVSQIPLGVNQGSAAAVAFASANSGLKFFCDGLASLVVSSFAAAAAGNQVGVLVI